jgi:hypothetical protein
MSEYKGLDENLTSTNSPQINQTTSYDVNSTFDRNSIGEYNMGTINASKINAGTISSGVSYSGTITANQIYGGTLTLGGTTNGNGVITVNGTAGTSTIKIDNTGISLISGTAVVDDLGLNSINNFYIDFFYGGTVTSNTTSYAPLTGGTLDTITLSRDTVLYLYFYGAAIEYADTTYGEIILYDNATPISRGAFFNGITRGVSTYKQSVYSGGLGTFGAGTHSITVQVRNHAAGTFEISDWEFGGIQMGN